MGGEGRKEQSVALAGGTLPCIESKAAFISQKQPQDLHSRSEEENGMYKGNTNQIVSAAPLAREEDERRSSSSSSYSYLVLSNLIQYNKSPHYQYQLQRSAMRCGAMSYRVLS